MPAADEHALSGEGDVRAPDLASPGPDYAELYASGAFAQRRLISNGNLAKAAAERGIVLPYFRRTEVLEELDRNGAFSPIAFSLRSFSDETTYMHPDPSRLVWREERHCEPWIEHGVDTWREGVVDVADQYSPWQLLYLGEAYEGRTVALAVEETQALARGDREALVHFRRRLDARRAQRATLDVAWRPFVKLLVALQPRLWPFRSGRTTLLYDRRGDRLARLDPLKAAVEEFDAHAVLSRFGLDLDGLARLHAEVARAGLQVDPTASWAALTEAAPRKRTDLFRGASLRARDLYDAAFMLRGLYLLATDRPLPTPDELARDRQTPWHRAHLPRQRNARRRSRADLKEPLIREGLYPHLLHIFVEGPTEEEVLGALLPALGLDPETSGVVVTSFRGIDKAERYTALFQSAMQYSARTVLIADREGELEKTLRRLRQVNLFADEKDVLLWTTTSGEPSSFEEANFTAEELVSAMRQAAAARGASLTLDAATLRSEFQAALADAARRRAGRPAIGKLATELAQEPQFGSVRLSKSRDIAPALAATLIDAIRSGGGLPNHTGNRPLLDRLWWWLADSAWR